MCCDLMSMCACEERRCSDEEVHARVREREKRAR